jgi:NADH-quinone oxidoreductase subunit C
VSLDAAAVQQKIEDKFPGKITHAELEVVDPFLVVDAAAIVDIGTYLRDEPELAFDMLHCHAAVDYLEEKEPEKARIEVVLHLTSLKHRHWIVLKVHLRRDEPKMPTLEGVWPTANWHEREAYDLFGIEFVGHSDFRRIFLPDDWAGHPLRKDWVWPEEWHGIKVKPDEKFSQRAMEGEDIGVGPFD